MKQIFKKKRIIIPLILLLIVGLGVGAYALFLRGNDQESSYEEVTQEVGPNEELELQNQQEAENERPEDDQPTKTPTLSNAEKPLVYTGYGHNSDKPLPKGQLTSTTCTTSANTECVIEFTNTNTNKTVTFDTKTTDAEGAAIWEWRGGQEVGSGTWSVVAKAGDKSSNPETIYVQ